MTDKYLWLKVKYRDVVTTGISKVGLGLSSSVSHKFKDFEVVNIYQNNDTNNTVGNEIDEDKQSWNNFKKNDFTSAVFVRKATGGESKGKKNKTKKKR